MPIRIRQILELGEEKEAKPSRAARVPRSGTPLSKAMSQGHYGRVTEFHEHYRFYRRKGFTKIESMELCKRNFWEDWKSFCDQQTAGVVMDCLDVKNEKRMAQIRSTGKLL